MEKFDKKRKMKKRDSILKTIFGVGFRNAKELFTNANFMGSGIQQH
jgi:hypothetical protein